VRIHQAYPPATWQQLAQVKARTTQRTRSAATRTSSGHRWSRAVGEGSTSMRAKDVLLKVSTRVHRVVFRDSKGRLLGTIVGLPVAELSPPDAGRAATLDHARSAHRRGRPVGAGGLLRGDDRQPAWYPNLNANPQVRVTIAGSTRTMIARTATDQERAQPWPRSPRATRGYARH
jgi:hypothetical protein